MRASNLFIAILILLLGVVGIDTEAAGPGRVNAKAEVETLMNAGIAAAKKMLHDRGDFFPFAVVMDEDGVTLPLVGEVGEAFPTAQEHIRTLERGFRENASVGHYRATALFVEVKVARGEEPPSPAIQVGLEHESGYCVNVFFPYTIDAESEVRFGEIYSTPRNGDAFGRCE